MNIGRGQDYDGASVMSGVYSGVQLRISDPELNASYVVLNEFQFRKQISPQKQQIQGR